MKSGAIVACGLALAGCASHAAATSLIGMTLAAALSGCANRPDSIHAEYISYERFAGLSCQELETRLADVRSRLEVASQQQNNAANADAVGVFLVLVPVSKLTGDHEAEVAQLKGDVEAIETAQIKGKCRPA